MFENVTFRVITNFPTHSFESFSTLCRQLLLVTLTDMAPVTPKRAKAPKTPRTPLTPSRIRISLEQKLKLIEEASKPGFNANEAATLYGTDKSTIYKILKNKDKLLNTVHQGKVTKKNVSKKNVTVGKKAGIEEALYNWCLEKQSQGVGISGSLMR